MMIMMMMMMMMMIPKPYENVTDPEVS